MFDVRCFFGAAGWCATLFGSLLTLCRGARDRGSPSRSVPRRNGANERGRFFEGGLVKEDLRHVITTYNQDHIGHQGYAAKA